MQLFETLGRLVESRWRARDYDEDAFADIAAQALSELPPSEHIEPMDIVRWVHSDADLGVQVESDFGDPPITVFRNERFYIDVLFWVDGTTVVHQHGFSGAFHVMAGKSIHSDFVFQRAHRFSERLMTGKLELRGVELLMQGDVRPIRAGSALIHSIFHIGRPSVSVVVRTIGDAFSGPQYSYLRPGLAYDPFFQTQKQLRCLQTLTLVAETRPELLEDLARASVRTSDALTAFKLLRHLAALIRPFARYEQFLASMREHHPLLVAQLEAASPEIVRESNIIERRGKVHQMEHRFLLALLLNVPDRDAILRMVEQAYPGKSPVDRITDWLAELSAIKVDGKNAIGIELDELSLTVFRALVGGADFEGLLATLAEEYDPADIEAQREDLHTLCEAFRGSLLLRPLFVRGVSAPSEALRNATTPLVSAAS